MNLKQKKKKKEEYCKYKQCVNKNAGEKEE